MFAVKSLTLALLIEILTIQIFTTPEETLHEHKSTAPLLSASLR